MSAVDAPDQPASVPLAADASVDSASPAGWPEGRRLPSRLSPSACKSYTECERQWAYERLERLPTVSHPAAVAGTHVHRVFEILMNMPGPDRTLDTSLSIHTDLLAELGATLNRVESEGLEPVIESLAGANDDLDHLRGVVRDFVESGATRRDFYDLTTAGVHGYFRIPKADPTKVKVRATELRMEAVWVTDAGTVPVGGIADRLDEIAEEFGGGIQVVDYKNGSLPNPKFDDGEGYRFQVLFYGALVESATGTLPRRGLLIYTREATPKPVVITREGVDEVKERVAAIWADINAKFPTFGYEPNPRVLCGWCPFVDRCVEGEAKVREVAAAGKLKETAPAWQLLAPLEGTPKPANKR